MRCLNSADEHERKKRRFAKKYEQLKFTDNRNDWMDDGFRDFRFTRIAFIRQFTLIELPEEYTTNMREKCIAVAQRVNEKKNNSKLSEPFWTNDNGIHGHVQFTHRKKMENGQSMHRTMHWK